jgi:deoxyribodipyrimidine photo-lyase
VADDEAPVLLWFREDLRLADNPAVRAAVESGRPVVAAYVLDQVSNGIRPLGAASLWWLHHSLSALAEELAAIGGALVLRHGAAADVLPSLAREAGATRVFFARRFGSASSVDRAVESALGAAGISVETSPANLLAEPGTILNGSGRTYRVFSAFHRALMKHLGAARPLHARPRRITSPTRLPTSDRLGDWRLLPTDPDWAAAFGKDWTPGEAGAAERLHAFIRHGLGDYDEARDLPAAEGSSRLSPHLRFGEVSPQQVWHAVLGAGGTRPAAAEKFMAELIWRDFAYALLDEWPDMADAPVDERFRRLPWRRADADLKAWQRGETGIPIVDAAMRQLWRTGWMPNRTRMIVASFLVKHLLVDWRAGERWFWNTLVDADPANNVVNWQWVAGSGADAAPFFRIFNPVGQGEKFDPKGDYVRRWLPELARLPDALIHRTYEADGKALAAAGVTLGETYPRPLVDLKTSRDRALAAFATTRRDGED